MTSEIPWTEVRRLDRVKIGEVIYTVHGIEVREGVAKVDLQSALGPVPTGYPNAGNLVTLIERGEVRPDYWQAISHEGDPRELLPLVIESILQAVDAGRSIRVSIERMS